MKKFLSITFIALLVLIGMTINVQAVEVTTWDDLTDELANGTDTEVTLSGDVSVTDTQILNLNGKTLNTTKTLVVDGGKLTITGNGKVVTTVADPLINVLNGGTLTLENGTYESTTYYGAAIQVRGSATDTDVKTKVNIAKDASITANYPVFIPKEGGFGVVVDVYGKLHSITTTKGSTTKYGAALYINGKLDSTTGNVPVINVYEGASVTAEESTAVYAAGYGIWNISGGYFEGTEALSIKGGEFYITGGTFKANGEYVENPTANNNGSEDTGSAISITGNDGYAGNIVLEISNATVTSENGYAVYETITNAVQPAVVEGGLKISSGNFEGKAGDVKADNITEFIEGGTFSDELDEKYLDTSVETEESEDGTILVGTKRPITINKTENGTVTASASEAIKGQKVTLTVTPAEGYKLKDLKVITVADSAVTVTENSFVMPDLGVIVSAEFEKVETSGEAPSLQQPAEPEPEPEEQKPAEKDETPKMGSINVMPYICIAIAAIALIGLAKNKKSSKH